MGKIFFGLTAALIVILSAATPFAAHFVIHSQALPIIEGRDRKLIEFMPGILNDLRLIEAHPPFAESEYGRDAAPVFDHYVPFEGARAQADIAEADKVERLFSRYPYWEAAPGERRKLLADDLGKDVSTEWLEMVHKYDHWNVTGREPAMARPHESPTPNYSILRAWALLHVLRREQSGAIVSGLQTLRQAAYLAHTSGSLVGHMAAAVLLRDERKLVETFRVSNWAPVDEAIIKAYERTALAWIGVWPTVFLRGLPADLEKYLKPQFGVCPSAWEYTPVRATVEDYFRRHFVTEPDFRENFRRTEELQKKLMHLCHLTPHPSLLLPRPTITNLPFLRVFFGIRAFALSAPTLAGYDRLLK